jgi:hypothetical protein
MQARSLLTPLDLRNSGVRAFLIVDVARGVGDTGARILTHAAKELATMPDGSRAIVSICADGGLGTLALLEN